MGVLAATETVFVFIFGALFGSFGNVVAYRVPHRISIVRPPSQCPNCSHQIRPWELIPICSWLILGGKCSACKKPISFRYPLYEVILASLWVLTFWHYGLTGPSFVWMALWWFLLVIVQTDLSTYTVPDILSLPAAVLFFAASCLFHVHTPLLALLGAVSGSGLIFLIHVVTRGRMGLGDVKLYLSLGAVLGPVLGLLSFIMACAFGAVLGILFRSTRLLDRQQWIPFVPFIALGVFTAQQVGPALVHWYVYSVLFLS